MLINIDHITLTSNSIEQTIEYYKNIGYKELFIEKNIHNLEIKADFMKNYKDTQTLCILKNNNGIPIEIIDDSKIISGKSFIKPVFETDYSIKNVEIYIKDKKTLMEQWKNIGFSIVDNANLTFTGFGNSYFFHINDCNDNSYFLDNEGFVCIAFISTSIIKDYNMMKQNMFKVSDIAKININNKLLNIFFAQGYNGEIFEIIEVTNG